MKLLGLFFASVFSQGQYTPPDPTPPPVVDPINCFHCDAANMTHCTEIGEEKPCQTDVPMACMIEVRKRDGAIESVSETNIAHIFCEKTCDKIFSNLAPWQYDSNQLILDI